MILGPISYRSQKRVLSGLASLAIFAADRASKKQKGTGDPMGSPAPSP
jgi:hypothetical protein